MMSIIPKYKHPNEVIININMRDKVYKKAAHVKRLNSGKYDIKIFFTGVSSST